MKSAKLTAIILFAAMISLLAGNVMAETVYTVKTMADDVAKVEGKEITIEGTIVGACKSGCKMWIADGQYKEGDLFTLVRAKDDAFKFDTKKHGAKVTMTGFVVAKYADFCGDKADHDNDKHTETKEVKDSCAAPVNVEDATKGDLEEMTFFATTVKYQD
ncbi:MAG: hypothetical protein GY780_08020 [bacterium]|nr:hypothetical protein [bacterium]